MGIAKVVKAGYPDPDPKKKGDWVQIDLAPVRGLKNPLPLSAIKADRALKNLPLIKQSRLSVMPITEVEYEHILKAGK